MCRQVKADLAGPGRSRAAPCQPPDALDRILHEIRSRLHRLGAENPATSRQPVRLEAVTYVLGTKLTYVSGMDILTGGGRSLARTALRWKFPENREFNGEIATEG